MMERYPFFRDEEERTQAVIGEAAVVSDLNGAFQKPYAVLTQKRLYCKTEQGNFITGADQLSSARMAPPPGMTAFGWVVFGISVLATVIMLLVSVGNMALSMRIMRLAANPSGVSDSLRFWQSAIIPGALAAVLLVLALIFVRKRPKVSLICVIVNSVICFATVIGLINVVLACVALVLYIKQEKDSPYEIKHTGGVFFFPAKDYTPGELSAFTAAVDRVIGGVL